MGRVRDPLDNMVLEVHQYLDKDGSGTNAKCVSAEIGVERLQRFTTWLRENKRRALLGEIGGGANPVAKCGEGESPSGFAYRNEPGGTPIKGDLATGGSDSVPTKKVVMLLQNGVRDAVIKGNEPGVSEYYYTRRVRAIAERTKKLIEDANKLESRLQAESSKGSRFSFFL